MKYKTGGAFRRALEDRLRNEFRSRGTPIMRLRKMVSFDRFLARLVHSVPERWVLKGGFALQLRMQEKARTTMDIDILLLSNKSSVKQLIQQAASIDLNDWFQFDAIFPNQNLLEDFGGFRVNIHSFLDGRQFESFHLDIGMQDELIEKPEILNSIGFLNFADLPSFEIPCYSPYQHMSEKIHAYTKSFGMNQNSRVKDLVDILLMAEMHNFEAITLKNTIKRTFANRNTHELPLVFPEPPGEWVQPFRKLSQETGLSISDLKIAHQKISIFLDPILKENVGTWNVMTWTWIK